MFHRFRRKKVEPLKIPTITETLPQSPHQQHSEGFPSVSDVQRHSTTRSNLSSYNIVPDHVRDSSVERRSRERSAERHADPLGLTVLFEPVEGAPSVDIIFVHGLGGTSQKTWSRNRDIEYFWPREWLPLESGFTQARVLSFGYNAHFATSGRENILNIADFAKDLLFGMKFGLNDNSEELGIGKVPIVFVAHSMGGLVVKKAYILGHNDRQYEAIISSTRAILFLSTPHRGTNLAELLNRILSVSLFNHSAKQYIAELKQNSPALQDINELFRNIAPQLQIFSFFETQQTAVGPRKMMVLEKDSSILGYPYEISKPLDADHHNVCKYTGQQDPNYVSVRNALRSVLPKVNPLELGAQAPFVDRVEMSKVEALLAVSYAPEDDLEYFRSLWMPGSCEWILLRPAFRSWIEDDHTRSSILWVNGLPGCGKSVLSSFVIEQLQDLGYSCQYFFFRAGDQSKRTVNLMLRSLAYQIAAQVPQLRKQLQKLADDALQLEKAEGRTLWQKVFASYLYKLQLRKPLYWVVDALDECEAPQKLLSLFSSISQSQTPLRIMFVGRNTPALSSAFQRMQDSIQLDTVAADGATEDLELYVSKEIEYMRGGPHLKDRITRMICKMANGNFLWVHLVLKEILQCHTEAGIEQALRELPPELEPLYQRIEKTLANTLRSGDRELSKRIMTWIICAQRALTLEELSEALKPNHDVLDLRVTVRQVCGDFVVVDNKGRVGMVHQTAREYLTKTSGLDFSIWPRIGHQDLFTRCISFLSSPRRRIRIERPLTQPFVHYAATSWPYHLGLSAASVDHSLLLALSSFFQGAHVLLWIQLLATIDHMKTLVYASQSLTSYLGKKSKVDAESSPLMHRLQEKELLELWAVDLVKIVGKFGARLVKYPRTIHTLIPALCPSESIIHQQFGQRKANETITVRGFSRQRWDDCLSKFSVGRDCQSLRIVCMDRYFTILTSDGILRLYDTITGQPSKKLVHGERVLSFNFSTSYEKCVTYSFRTTKVWHVEDSRQLFSIPNPTNAKAVDVSFASDESAIVSCSDDRRIRRCLLDSSEATWQTLNVQMEFEGADGRQYNSSRRVAFNTDGSQVAVAFRGFPLVVWDVNTTKPVGHCKRTTDKDNSKQDLYTDIGPICWNNATGHVLGLYNDGCVFKWHPTEADNQELRTVAAGVQCSPGGTLFVTSSTDGVLKVWDFHHLALVYQLSCHNPVVDVALSPDGRRIYDIRDSFCNIWEPNALIRLAEADEKSSETSSTAAGSTQISLASEASSEVLEPLTALAVGTQTMPYCSGDDVGAVRLHASDDDELSQISQGFMPVDHIVWSHDEQYLVTADLGGRLNVRLIGKSTSRGSEPPVGTNPPKGPQLPSPMRTIPHSRYPLVLEAKTGNGLQQVLINPSSEYFIIATITFVELWSLKLRTMIVTKPNSDPYSRWVNHPLDPTLLVQCTFSDLRTFRWLDLQDVATSRLDKVQMSSERTLPTDTGNRGQSSWQPPTDTVPMSSSGGLQDPAPIGDPGVGLSNVSSTSFPMSPDENHVAVDGVFISSDGPQILLQRSMPSGQRHRTIQYIMTSPPMAYGNRAPARNELPGGFGPPSSPPLKSTLGSSIDPAASDITTGPETRELPTFVSDRIQKILGFVIKSPRRRSSGLLGEADPAVEVLTFIDHDDWVCSWLPSPPMNEKIRWHFFLPQDWLNPDSLRLATVSRDGRFYCPRNGEVAVVTNWLQNEWNE
ncbi:MAG: hypothetical protein Q9181_002279 [Wetmoreana brouardii]